MCVSVSCSKNINWVFAEMFGQWRSVSIRYTALPPALVRGVVRVAHTGTGGSSSPTYLSQKRTRNKDGKYRKIILLNALQPGIRTPPVTSVRTGDTPLVNAGGKASNHPRALTARQIPICRSAEQTADKHILKFTLLFRCFCANLTSVHRIGGPFL